MPETWVHSLGQEDSLEKGMATHSSILAQRIPYTEKPGRLQSFAWDRTHTNQMGITLEKTICCSLIPSPKIFNQGNRNLKNLKNGRKIISQSKMVKHQNLTEKEHQNSRMSRDKDICYRLMPYLTLVKICQYSFSCFLLEKVN